MLHYIIALLLPFLLSLLIGPYLIRYLHKLKYGQTEYELGPESHKKKQGTPTMGGLMIAFTVTVTTVICNIFGIGFWQDATIGLLAAALLSMLVGFLDDYIKVVKKRSLGLTPWQKIAGQVLVAGLFTAYCYFHPQIGSKVIVPFANIEWDLGLWYLPLMFVTVLLMVNSANLLDGLDGLLSTVACIGSGAWAVIALFSPLLLAFMPGSGAVSESTAVFALAIVGALMGFLRFNYYPAKVIMGDTGSMFIGGATVAIAMVLRLPLLLIPIAFWMLASSFSVILQRYYFKLTHGKRIFKMSPVHHHFELSGWSETQIVAMYGVTTAILAIVSVIGVCIR
ncbi:MAG: phospho-N-acetylmuramoyl-pentapeptide-transferase [Eubacteriales bacterium]|nr:phospho-N-acetylmuramoyl-pentapeptide-transferase [Eubacteriales bacterium]MDD3880823.1 phospho-N-acetylmuramoyl-pentapeptide-transferase [Eubacteriales bacterium]MDD4511810.1 phospho-N-acetylmuramoyl-pentapeptide-transferase [Eubacteriales bacterium]